MKKRLNIIFTAWPTISAIVIKDFLTMRPSLPGRKYRKQTAILRSFIFRAPFCIVRVKRKAGIRCMICGGNIVISRHGRVWSLFRRPPLNSKERFFRSVVFRVCQIHMAEWLYIKARHWSANVEWFLHLNAMRKWKKSLYNVGAKWYDVIV